MDLAALRAFSKVARYRSFSLAARDLRLTQPAVSKRVAALEAELATRLFDRVSSSVELTEAGGILLGCTHRILAEVNAAEEQIRSLHNVVSGRLRMGTSHHIGLHRLPPVLRRFSSDYPDVELDLKFMDSELACQQVETGELELAVVTLPQHVPDKLLTHELWPDPLAIVTPVNHPLATVSGVTPAQLAEHAAVLPAHGTITRSILAQRLSALSIDINVALETNYLETIKMMVSVGLGWSVLPRSMLSAELVAIDIPELDLHRSLGAVRLRNRTLTRAAQHFLQSIESD